VLSATIPNTFGMVTNYQVVAESAARAVIRFDKKVTATGTNYTSTVESYNPLPPD
jgi:transposase-like protein